MTTFTLTVRMIGDSASEPMQKMIPAATRAEAVEWCRRNGYAVLPTKRYMTESVPTNTLKVGDTILAHGGLFRVIEVKVSQCHGDSPTPVHANYCEFIGNAYEGHECSIPAAWRSGAEPFAGRPALDNFWNQQGNSLARTTRVLGVDHCGE